MGKLSNIIKNVKLDVVCISETWLNPDITNRMVHLPGFNLFRNDRYSDGVHRRGGGVVICVKNDINAKIVGCSGSSREIEFLFVDLRINSCNYLLCCVYKPPDVLNFDAFESTIADLNLNYTLPILLLQGISMLICYRLVYNPNP